MRADIREYILRTLPKTVKECRQNEGTLLALPFPYTVPCVGEMFSELYYWDTYFTNVGLLAFGDIQLAKYNVDNMLHLVNTYGFMPNGNRTYYCNRSQPPFLWRMVNDVYAVTNDTTWLSSAYDTLCKEYAFWQDKRMLPLGLNAYTGYAVQSEDLAMMYEHFVSRTGYRPSEAPSEEMLRDVYQATFSFFESGWDCNSRFLGDGHKIAAVDLNSLLYGMEKQMAEFARILGKDTTLWEQRASTRKQRMKQWLWDETTDCYADYNTRTKQHVTYRSAASLYPLFVGLADEEEAERTAGLFERLCGAYGVTAGEASPLWNCQWDYPNVWAPLQWIAYGAMKRYGLEEQAQKVRTRFMRLVEKNFDATGNFWEKYNGISGTVASEEYEAPPMMGWTAGVYMAFAVMNEE